jgi:hypothetical protein
MTMQRRIIADVRDIHTVVFECKCGERTPCHIDASKLPETCFKCGQRLILVSDGNAPAVQFITLIKKLRERKENGGEVNLLLEFDDPR